MTKQIKNIPIEQLEKDPFYLDEGIGSFRGCIVGVCYCVGWFALFGLGIWLVTKG